MVTANEALDAWLAYRRPNPHARLRLFCFPYAGGGASIFSAWFNHLPAQIEVCPVQLPGRGNRLKEVPCTRLARLVDLLAQALVPSFDKPFAFFGHSMGASIGFELARHLRRHDRPQPVHLFVSGARAPHVPDPEPPIHMLPEKAFAEAIRGFDGTPEEILQHEELMNILLPCLRADFEICETHTYEPEAPLSIPVTVFGGWQDKKVRPHHLGPWHEQTLNTCRVHMFPGDHFFLHAARKLLLETISDELGLF